MHTMPGDPSPPHWKTYIGVDDIDGTTAAARDLGATVLVEPTDIPGMGRFSIVADPNVDNLVYVGGDAKKPFPFTGNLARGDSTANTWTATGPLSLPRLLHAASLLDHCLGVAQIGQREQRCLDDIHRVRRAKRLAQNVLDPRCFDHGARSLLDPPGPLLLYSA